MTDVLPMAAVEEMVNGVARDYAWKEFGIPARALQVVLWPTDKFVCIVERGPTAIIRLGILPNDPHFRGVLRGAIERIHKGKMWESMELESIADILRREKRWKTYSFDSHQLRGMLKPEEMHTKIVTRVEVSHPSTKIREVVEVEHGQSIFAAKKLAETRLSRRVLEESLSQTEPWKLPSTHPDWVAQTN